MSVLGLEGDLMVALLLAPQPLVRVELAALAPHPLEGVQVPRLVQVLLPLLGDPALGLQLRPRLPPLQDPVVLLGVDVERLLLEHLGPGQRDALLDGRRAPAAAARHHHDHVLAVGAAAGHLDHLVGLALARLLDVHLGGRGGRRGRWRGEGEVEEGGGGG